MKIVIIGLGTIGSDILKTLSKDKHTITIIDEDKKVIDNLVDKYDIQGVVGNGASLDIQVEANMKNADMAIVLTKSDELNIFACMVAKKLGVNNTIARVRNPDYRRQVLAMQDELGISMIVNPEKDTASEIFNLINLPEIVEAEHFANNKALLVEIVAEPGCALINESLISIGQKLNTKVLICAVQRGEEVIIPTGHFVIQEGDQICFTADTKDLRDFLAEINIVKSPLKNIMIVGGSKVAYYLADQLSKRKHNVKLIEQDASVANMLAEDLSKTTVIVGNGAQHDLLIEEGIEAMDAFVALTNADEENMIISMFANKMGVKKTITQIKSDDLYGMLSELGIKNNVSPKDIVADRIVSYIRAVENSRGNNALALYHLIGDKVEALEFAAKKQEKFYNKPLRELKLKKDCLIACIVRDLKVIIPDGNEHIELGDNVVVVTTHKNFNDLKDILE